MSDSGVRGTALHRLLLETRAAGRVELCRLTDDQQTALGGIDWALAEAATATAWAALALDEQRRRLDTAVDDLEAAGLVTAAGPQPDADLVPSSELALVVAGRTRPVYVAVAGGPEGSAVLAPRMYAIADEMHGLWGLLVELSAGGVHGYRFVTTDFAARELVLWARLALTTRDLGDRVDRVAVELVRHREGEQLTWAGAVLGKDDRGLIVARRFFGGERDRRAGTTDDEAANLLRELLERAAD